MISFYRTGDMNKNVNINNFCKKLKIGGEPFVFFIEKNLCKLFASRSFFVDVAVVRGGGWVFRGVGP